MNFLVSVKDLREQMAKVQGAIVTKPVLPILENFLLDIKDGQLNIYSTDLETSMMTSMQVESKEDVQIAVPSKLMLDFLRNQPDGPVNFAVNDETFAVTVSSSATKGSYELPGQSGIDFPQMPAIESESGINIPANILLRAITKASFATGVDELRPALTGMKFELNEGGITFVATDANKFVRVTRTDIKPGIEHDFILPKKALNLLKTSLPNDDTPVSMEWNKSNVFFTYGTTRLICRLIDERYPDYRAVIPADNNNVLSIGRQDLLQVIRRVIPFASKTTVLVRLKLAGSELVISTEDIEMATKSEETLTCDYDGTDLEIGFNGNFLRDMLSLLDGDRIQIRLSTPNRAGLIMPEENEKDEDMLMLIMPLMLSTYS
ncbi:MAG: DNA polymerase III subunit beta [Bacteroidota bacterium]|jgi:DNA polymerase III subunit beta